MGVFRNFVADFERGRAGFESERRLLVPSGRESYNYSKSGRRDWELRCLAKRSEALSSALARLVLMTGLSFRPLSSPPINSS
jgi:hypothetical protein